MNFKARLYKPALLVLAALLMCGVGQMQQRLNVDRKELGMTRTDPLVNAPPMLAFTTVALGGFRGLIANALWLRLSDLQEEDKYFEMVQLADWITKLQPHMVSVWQFQAWNMAYNISVKFKSHEDRWHWVQRGVSLLRDEAIRYNPHETKLYRDLSWLFQHKIGANLDDAHLLYKLRWAQEMQGVLGGHPDFKELLNPTTPEARERARKLKEVYKMDPASVQKVDEEYGPFDWRLPDAHAVYWAEMGRMIARPEDQETLRRSVFQSMQQMFVRGGGLLLASNVTPQNFMLWPNLAQVPVINATYEKMIAEETNNAFGLQKNFQTGHKNFLKQAIYLLYEDGREKQAQYWFNYLTNLYTNAFVGKEAHLSMRDYAISQIIDDNNQTDANKVEASLLAMYDRALVCYARDNDAYGVNSENLARAVAEHYAAKTGGADQRRVKLKPLPELKRFVWTKDLDPKTGFPPEARAILLSKPGLKESWAPPVAPTNATEKAGATGA